MDDTIHFFQHKAVMASSDEDPEDGYHHPQSQGLPGCGDEHREYFSPAAESEDSTSDSELEDTFHPTSNSELASLSQPGN